MNDKEYTYDIDKYTIGVDENGEDGIGLTVAKVENGEIYFLGNCYGENARCLDLLIKENQALKKQVEEKKMLIKQCDLSISKVMDCYCERTDCSGRIKDSKQYDSLVQKVETQQKEFIKYLEDEINNITTQYSQVNGSYFLLDDKIKMFEKVLQKYKEIVGAEDD